MAHFTAGAILLFNPAALMLALYRLWAVARAPDSGDARTAGAVAAVAAVGILAAVLIEDLTANLNVQAALLLPWWALFMAVTFWGELKTAGQRLTLLTLPAIIVLPCIAAALLAVVFAMTVFFAVGR